MAQPPLAITNACSLACGCSCPAALRCALQRFPRGSPFGPRLPRPTGARRASAAFGGGVYSALSARHCRGAPSAAVAQGALCAQGFHKPLRGPCAHGPPRPAATPPPRLPLRGTVAHLTARGLWRADTARLGRVCAPVRPLPSAAIQLPPRPSNHGGERRKAIARLYLDCHSPRASRYPKLTLMFAHLWRLSLAYKIGRFVS